jgi:hypothetical protein
MKLCTTWLGMKQELEEVRDLSKKQDYAKQD